MSTNKPWHPHDTLIREWLDNRHATVEYLSGNKKWEVVINPSWHPTMKYRLVYPEPSPIDKLQAQIDELQAQLEELKNESSSR